MSMRRVLGSGLVVMATAASAWAAGAEVADAAMKRNADAVRALLLRKANVNTPQVDGTTALHWAVRFDDAAMAEMLIRAGANVSAANRDGVRPLQLAAMNGSAAMLDRLMKAGADPNAPLTQFGDTALMMAARNGDLGMLQALLSRGADWSLRDGQGHSVLEWAEPSTATAKYVVSFLVDRGVSKAGPRVVTPAPSPQVKASLSTLASVLARVPPASDAIRTAQRRANAALSQLQGLSAAWPAESPDDYRDNLAGAIAALEGALKLGDVEALATTLEAVAEDLETKLEHCTKSGGKLGGSIVVRVRTVQGGVESRSWQVFYMPRVFEAATNATPDVFPQLSSPTQETLVPGRYVMWVRDPATSRVGERLVVKVGEGRAELLVDLSVPALPPR